MKVARIPIEFFFVLVVIAAGFGNAFGQQAKTVTRRAGSDVVVSTYVLIPEATESCTPAECEWWTQIRRAGNELQRKGDEKSKRTFVNLFVVGMEKSYRVPLADRPSMLLVPGPPARSQGVPDKNGKVELSIEVRADTSIGNIKVIKSVRSDMDQRCMESLMRGIYLPAVKNHAFAGDLQNGSCTFWSKAGQ